MGFESQEEAERWAENMEFRADQLKEERMLETPKVRAWREITELPGYRELGLTDGQKGLLRAVFDHAWDRALRTD